MSVGIDRRVKLDLLRAVRVAVLALQRHVELRLLRRFLRLLALGLRDLPRENDARGEEGHHRHREQEDHRARRAAGRQHHGGEAEDAAHHVQRRHRLLLVEAHVDEPVMDVSAVRRHGVLTVGDAAHDGKKRVEHRQAQDQERYRERDDGVVLEKALYGDRCERIAQKRRARVPHEHLRGIAVIGHEADARARERRHDERDLPLRDQQRDHQHRHGADDRHAVGKPVQPVDEVDRVRDAHDPQHRDRNRRPAQRPVRLVAEQVRVGQHVYHDPVVNRDQRREDLHEELEPRAQRRDVVHHAEHDDDDRALQNAAQLPVDGDKDQQAHDKAEEDREAAEARHRLFVHAPVVLRHVDRADLIGERLYQRADEIAQHHGAQQRLAHPQQQFAGNACIHK